MNKFDTYGEFYTRYAALKAHPNAIIRLHLKTGVYVVFYDHTTFKSAINEKCVRGY